ncbi:hypothetical protein, partial [Dysosmobacter sp.]|uniref:hypothetical protein n=1 Tax=Dysosmobacter sp. TaxID=2591382 RepID=UPI00307E1EAF
VKSSLSVFSFDHEWPFSFRQDEKKMGIQSSAASPHIFAPIWCAWHFKKMWGHSNRQNLYPLQRSAASRQELFPCRAQ